MELTTPVYDELRAIIQRLCGLALGEDKEYLVRHRLEPIIDRFGCTDFRGLITRLSGFPDPALADAVVDAITTKETAFFRDSHPFEVLRLHLLPQLHSAARQRALPHARPQIHIWSAATSTGQEAYTLAMLVHEYCRASQSGSAVAEFGILASDISPAALSVARASIYSVREVQRGLTEPLIQRYFQRHGETNYQVLPTLRQLVEFRRLNLLALPPALGPFDLIVCRNVLLYFDHSTRQRICQQLYQFLLPGGYLIIGAAESLYGISNLFITERIDQTTVYRRL